jgi:hypothetical protein
VLLVQPELVTLLQGQFEGVSVVGSVEEAADIDCWTRNYTLPHLLGVRGPEDVQSAPYLRAPATFRRLPGEFKVGIVWAGNPEHSNDRSRSTPLVLWEPVLGLPSATFYSLQLGPAAAELHEPHAGMIEDLGPDLTDWAQTGGAVGQLDLVISVDTAVAHLAGALGVPLWLCLPTPAEYRWGIDGGRTHWYPSARLFREVKVG